MSQSPDIRSYPRMSELAMESVGVSSKLTPKKRRRSPPSPESSDSHQCPICLEIIEINDERSLPCGHMFHVVCFDDMVKRAYGDEQTHNLPLKRGPPFTYDLDDFRMLLSLGDKYIRCPLCRKEFGKDRYGSFVEILGRVWFNHTDHSGKLLCHQR